MIEEELYQQAADELKSDRRRPHIWARACALASDDHDEARFLYTNLRVEELLEERRMAASRGAGNDDAIAEHDATLALVDDVDTDNNDMQEFLQELRTDDDNNTENNQSIPESIPAPSGKDLPESPDDLLTMEAPSEPAVASTSENLLDEEPDADLMEDYVPEQFDNLDDTYAGEGLGEDEFAKELASFKAEEAELETPDQASTDADNFDEHEGHVPTSQENASIDPDFSAEFDLDSDDVVAFNKQRVGDEALEPHDQTDVQPHDMTQANLDVLDAHAGELQEMLGETRSPPSDELDPATNTQWLEDEISTDRPVNSPAASHEAVIEQEDPYTEELTRQADELDLGQSAEETADFSQKIAEELSQDRYFPETASQNDQESMDSQLETDARYSHSPEPEAEAEPEDSSIAASIEAPIDASGSSSAASGAIAATGAVVTNGDGLRQNDTTKAPTLPLDLTQDREGQLYGVYRRHEEAQAIKSGVSWSALFFTFPFLLYRQLFGTAFAYALLWIIAVGGLIISGLAWLDAGSSVTPLTQACTIGFGLLAFIGLVYLPFRYGNTWRSEKLENRGFELVAMTKATNPGRAIARARRHSAFDL